VSLNRVPRYVNWTAKKGLQKSASSFADSISAGVPQNSLGLSQRTDTFEAFHGKRNALPL
jgi:hypothetical protein